MNPNTSNIDYNSPQIQAKLQQIQQSPLLQTLFAPYMQPGAQLGETEAQIGATQQSQATSQQEQQNLATQQPGEAAQSQVSQIGALKTAAPLNLSKDIQGGMTLSKAMNTYGQFMDQDQIFQQYARQNPQGLMKQYGSYNNLINQAGNLGISGDTLGKVGVKGSFADKANMQDAITSLRTVEGLYNQITPGDFAKGLIGVDPKVTAYNQAANILRNHLSTLIPGAPGSQGAEEKLESLIPSASDPRNFAPGMQQAAFKGAEDQLLSEKGYSTQDLGLTPRSNQQGQLTVGQATQNPVISALQAKGAFMGDNGDKMRPGGGGGYKDIANALPTILGIGGAALGAAVPVGGETGATEIAGGALGSGAGQFLSNLLQGKPLGQNVGESTATGLIGGGIGRGVGAVGGAVLKAAGGAEVTGGLNFTRAGMNTLNTINKEPVQQTLIRNNLIGASAEGIQQGVAKAQQDFDAVAKNTNISIDQNSLLNNAVGALSKLEQSSVPSQKALAGKVSDALDNVFTKVANGSVKAIGDLNNERKDFDAATADSQFGNADWGVNRIVGSILRKSVQDTADGSGVTGPGGQSLKDMGQNLNKLYNISSMADKRVGQGNSAGIMSISNMIMAGLGSQALGGGPLGLMLGGGATYAVRRLLASSPIAKVLAKGAIGAGKAISKPAVSTAGGVATGGLFNYLMQQ